MKGCGVLGVEPDIFTKSKDQNEEGGLSPYHKLRRVGFPTPVHILNSTIGY